MALTRLGPQSTYIGPVVVGIVLGAAATTLSQAAGYVTDALLTHGISQLTASVHRGSWDLSLTLGIVYAAGGLALGLAGFLFAFWLYPLPGDGENPS